MADALPRTVQLRRYRIAPGELGAFTAWFRERLLPARLTFGFRFEFALAVPVTDEFVWAVSVEGGPEELARLDAAWMASPERARAFDGVPQRVAAMDLAVADPVFVVQES